MKEQQVGIQSVETAIDILFTFRNYRTPLPLTTLSQITGVPKGNLHKYLVSLIRKGMVQQNKDTSLYALGPAILDLGMWQLSSIDLDAIYEEHIQKLSIEVDQSVSVALALWQENAPIIVRYKKSNRPINIEMQLGYRPSPIVSATGKCFLAYLNSREQEAILQDQCQPDTLKVLRSELNDIRKNGLSFRLEEYDTIPGSKAIAAPIFNHNGEIVASISLIGFSKDFELHHDSEYALTLKQHAEEISKKLLYSKANNQDKNEHS